MFFGSAIMENLMIVQLELDDAWMGWLALGTETAALCTELCASFRSPHFHVTLFAANTPTLTI